MKTTGQSRLLNAIWLAGLVFSRNSLSDGNSFATKLMIAFQWVVSSLLEIDDGRGYRAASKLADSLNEVWSQRGVDPWEVVGRVFEESWRNAPQSPHDVDTEGN
jgi:hypothetical protein